MTIPIAEEFHTPVPFKVLTDSPPVMDGAGQIYIAFQAERPDNAHTKYCRVVKRVGAPGSEAFEDVCEVVGIYAEPKLMIRATDGGCTVSGLSHDKHSECRANVPGFVPRLTDAEVRGLMARVKVLEARVRP